MAQITRQQTLLVAEDWTKVYQSFRNADFKAYDYETLRKSMIDYLRLYYPEDFNDFIESSEYIALIDLIAFLGQNLAFRADLNARENFIDTAERRDSVLRLARLVNYRPQRNVPASGVLKIDSISTTEEISDSDGVSLSNALIFWNDNTNSNWYEQFVTVMNSAMISGQRIGKPGNSQYLNGVKTDEYSLRLSSQGSNVYKFKSVVNGSNMIFEAVSGTTIGQSFIYESSPNVSSTFNVIARNDNLGNASNNTGFFVLFKQGELQSVSLNFQESLVNRVVSINTDNINNLDIWLYQLNSLNFATAQWAQLPNISNTNIAYNTVNNVNRKIFEVASRGNDQIDLVFGDGIFADIPQGPFTLFYRTSNNLDYRITPDEISNVQLSIPYLSKAGRTETLTLSVSLKYSVTNAKSRETLSDIRTNAPQQYYVQNRMVNGEDYNVLPFTKFNNLIKVKAVNRTSSGISRYLDVLDTTGKYSSTNIFCDDGIVYRQDTALTQTFEFTTISDIQQVIESKISPILNDQATKHFYYSYFTRYTLTNTYWNQQTIGTNTVTGNFQQSNGDLLQIGAYVGAPRIHLRPGAIVKFDAGAGNYFDINRTIQTGTPTYESESRYIYTSIKSVDSDGTFDAAEIASFGNGPVALTDIIPDGAEAIQVIAPYVDSLNSTVRQEVVDYIDQYQNFGLGYDPVTLAWYTISPNDLNATGSFSQTYATNTTSGNLDASWLIKFTVTNAIYTITYRGLDYYFESELQTRFYFDNTQRVFDPKTGLVVTDQIKVLKINSQPDSATPLITPTTLAVYDSVIGADGYENNERVRVTFNDIDDDGVPNNPDFFIDVVAPSVNTTSKRVYYKIESNEDRTPISSGDIILQHTTQAAINAAKTRYANGTVFYASTDNAFYVLTIAGNTRTITVSTSYEYKVGRQDLSFQYRHNSPNNRRIDPSPNNIIDLYLLTKNYSDDYVRWVTDATGQITEPTIPSSEDLLLNFSDLENYKMISDTIIYNTAVFKPLFGAKAAPALRGTFKVVKSSVINISDTEIKSRLITALNEYFSIDNWDFGETFYYTELSAYLHNKLASYISSVVIVSQDTSQKFGNLFQVNAGPDEIFVSAVTAEDIQIIPAITNAQLNQV